MVLQRTLERKRKKRAYETRKSKLSKRQCDVDGRNERGTARLARATVLTSAEQKAQRAIVTSATQSALRVRNRRRRRKIFKSRGDDRCKLWRRPDGGTGEGGHPERDSDSADQRGSGC